MSETRMVWLASGSARRRQLLEEAGVAFQVRRPDVDDGQLRPGGTPPRHWAVAMAYLKGRHVAEQLRRDRERGLVIAADTICSVDGLVLGQPRTAPEAAEMIHRFRGRDHRTITGVCLIDVPSGRRRLLVDQTIVHVGPIDEAEIDRYVRSGRWQGKAGGYNLDERLAAGWPVEVTGDPTTVTGLPMRRLLPLVAGG
ncbi:MAG: Maf family protein [Planctomycetota bacterium]|jgi:septum formation protein